MSRWGDGVWSVIVTARAFVILLLFSFPDLSSLVIDEVVDTGAVVRLRALGRHRSGCARAARARHDGCTPGTCVASPIEVAGRSVVIELHVRRRVCRSCECPQRTFRQQVPELALRYARRTPRLTTTVGRQAITLAGRAGAAVLTGWGDDLAVDGVAGADGATDPTAADAEGA